MCDLLEGSYVEKRDFYVSTESAYSPDHFYLLQD